jgi:biotin carboxyl carrier protein
MYFEAELKDKKFKVDVIEHRNHWKISIQEGDKDWVRYEISKQDFKRSESYFSFLFKGASYLVDVLGKDTEYTVFTRNSARTVKIFNDEMLLHESLKRDGLMGNQRNLRAGMPGKIIQLFVKPGDIIKGNKPILIMEAMKMENEMRSVTDVKIKDVLVSQGDSVETGQILVTFDDP